VKINKRITLIVCLLITIIFIVLFCYNNTNDANNLKQTKEAMVNIALGNDTVKFYLGNMSYSVSEVNTKNNYVLIDESNSTSIWGYVMVGIDLDKNTTTYTYYIEKTHPLKNLDQEAIMLNIAFNNETVKKLTTNEKYAINEVNVSSKFVYIHIETTSNVWYQLIVGIDINKNKTTSISSIPETPAKLHP
jgi:hypothetical protein